jgi:hypothetical protein
LAGRALTEQHRLRGLLTTRLREAGGTGHGRRMTSTPGGPTVRDTTTRHAVAGRVHRWVMIVGALLTAIALLLLSLLPSVPSEAVAMTAWVERGHSLLSWSDELLFFAVICLGVGARGLFGANQAAPSVRINVGVTALATALVALVVLLLAVGRLVYPVFEIQLSAEVLALVVSSMFGALHLAFLGFAVAAVALSWSTRARLIGRAVGIFAAASFIVGSFPWLVPNWCNSLIAVLVAVWGVFLAHATAGRAENPSDTTETMRTAVRLDH